MIENSLYNTIINNPIYLCVVVVLCLLLIYSALKKFIKLLAIVLVSIIIYLAFLYFTNDQKTLDDVDKVLDTMQSGTEFLKEKIENSLDDVDDK